MTKNEAAEFLYHLARTPGYIKFGEETVSKLRRAARLLSLEVKEEPQKKKDNIFDSTDQMKDWH